MSKGRTILILSTAVLAIVLTSAAFAPPGLAQAAPNAIATIRAATSASVAPVRAADLPLGDRATAAEISRARYWSNRLPLAGPSPRAAGAPVGPRKGTETLSSLVSADAPMAPASFLLYQNTSIAGIPAGFSSSTNEPSTASGGRNRFQTGNWYAAYSSNGGSTWTHLSPFTAFPSIDGGFCCDQDTLYDPSRNLFIWLLQYIKDASDNHFRIAVFRSETANISNAGWYYYDFSPAQFGGAGGEWFDYPHLALTEDFLYLAINVFRVSNDTWTRTIFARFPLDTIRAGATLGANYWSQSSYFNVTPVQGAKDVIYFASQISGTGLAVFRWPENSGSISGFGLAVPAWTVGTTHSCPGPDGRNWCARSDNRVLAGTLGWNQLTKQAELTFFWNVAQGAGFTWPYINAAKFRESDLAYLGRPYLWNGGTAFHYIGAAPNARGDIGLSVQYGGGSVHPSSAVCIDDSFNGDPPGWECTGVRAGAHGPDSNRWGDYLRVRPAYPGDNAWTATSYTLQASTATGNAEPRNVVFGRERDYFGWLRYYNR